ncbi:tetratricopeptide repeat protein [Streptacidiphilus sp. N1-1]|uniref:Tetratricopeptide repeat protein n=1 Tax=Streptacidiphilus alkalitolerans TaxID=3342712 RepID=A0ABV6V6R1_9ACTN
MYGETAHAGHGLDANPRGRRRGSSTVCRTRLRAWQCVVAGAPSCAGWCAGWTGAGHTGVFTGGSVGGGAVADGRDFFISYAGPDGAWARWVAWHLEQAGYTVELAEWDWAVGQNFVEKMGEALRRATRVVALFSPAYFEPGRFTRDEWTSVRAVRDRGKDRLLPFRIEKFPHELVPDDLRSLLYRDLFDLPEDQAREALLDAVAGPRRPNGAPIFPGHGRATAAPGTAPALPSTPPSAAGPPTVGLPANGVDARSPAGTERARDLAEIEVLVGRAERHAQQERFRSAAMLWEEVAADRTRVLGPDHPDTLASRYWHARCLGMAGEAAEAVELSAGVAADRARILGPDHPDTLNSRHNHAWALGVAGEVAEAVGLSAGVAADRARILGPDHPDTLNSRHNHAWGLGVAGDFAEAARLMAGVAADRARVLGADHVDTLASRDNHAWVLGEAGDFAEAARLMAGVAADHARVLGPDHPDTLASRASHAWALGEAGDFAEAARLMAGVAADRARVLGADHPDTLHSRRVHAENSKRAAEGG